MQNDTGVNGYTDSEEDLKELRTLFGYVKNLYNGDVLIEVEGEEENINKLIDWCYVGSPLSRVTEVIAEESELKHYETFELKK